MGGMKKREESLGGGKIPDHFGNKRFGQSQTGKRFATVAFPFISGHESVELTKFDNANELGFLGREGSEFGFESREEFLLQAV
jgi:hypothetical protein